MIITDFAMVAGTDNTVVLTMTPAVPVAGWSIRWTLAQRLGSASPIATKYYASGFNGVSGISIVNSGAGILSIRLNAIDTSGLDQGNYANWGERLTSGAVTRISEGFAQLFI